MDRPRTAGGGAHSIQELLGIGEVIEGVRDPYRELAENLQEVLWVGTPDWQQVLYVNPAYETLWGRSVQSLYDAPLSWLEAVVEEDRERVREDLQAKVASRVAEPDFTEYRVVRPDGSTRWVMARAFPIRNADGEVWRVAGVAVDVTRHREAEERARRSQRDYRTLARNLPCIVYRVLLGEGCATRFYNDAVETLTGYPVSQLPVGEVCSIDPLILDEDRPRVVDEVRSAVKAGRTFAVSYRIRRADGEVRHFGERGQPVAGDDGEPRFIDGVIFDMTERARTEEALRAARDELEEKVRERTAELARRAQQLARLTSGLTLAEQRERRRLASLLQDNLQQLLVGAKLGLTMLASRVDDGGKGVVEQTDELLQRALSVARDLTVELSPPILYEAGLGPGLEWLARRVQALTGLAVEIHVEAGVEPAREDVAILLFEAVRELLRNVVQHAKVATARVDVASCGSHLLQVVVMDRGVGFDADARLRSPVPGPEGLGLLGIRERLGLLGGDMRIESSAGCGTRVVLIAPRRRDGAGTGAAQASARGSGATASILWRSRRPEGEGTGMIRVLLVDDHVVMRQGLSLLLEEHADIDVVGEASDGEQAVESAARLVPDVILMDLSMPKMNGIDATRTIHAALPQVAIIGLSMYEEQDRADAMLEAGAVAYLTKTGNPADLLTAIRRLGRGMQPRGNGDGAGS